MYVSRAPVQDNILVSVSSPESMWEMCDSEKCVWQEQDHRGGRGGRRNCQWEFNETESKQKLRHLKRERPAGMDGEVKVRGGGLPEWTRWKGKRLKGSSWGDTGGFFFFKSTPSSNSSNHAHSGSDSSSTTERDCWITYRFTLIKQSMRQVGLSNFGRPHQLWPEL